MLTPTTPAEIQSIVKEKTAVYPIGGQSKPGLSRLPEGFTGIDMRSFNGIVTYDPEEYTITAQAGTAVADIQAAVAEHGQYLPFDPLFVRAGATLGGTVAANSGGSGRFRYGGVRDFILGVRFIDGQGRLVRGGGQVVKNASGFDLPKFMTGSLGRYGILTEITLKIFPQPAQYETIVAEFATLATALEATFALANQPFEMDALDFRPHLPGAGPTRMWIRLGGLPASLPGRIERLSGWLRQHTAVSTLTSLENEATFWQALNGQDWAAKAAHLLKVPVAPRQVLTLNGLGGVTAVHYAVAGNLAWVTTDEWPTLNESLKAAQLSGQFFRGGNGRPLIGHLGWLPLAQRVKQALDPAGVFPGVF